MANIYEVIGSAVMNSMRPQGGANGLKLLDTTNRDTLRTLASQVVPSWRDDEMAPGVNSPGEGMYPLPLEADAAGGVFSATSPTLITFKGQLQVPFRGERFLTEVDRIGTTATGRLLGQVFVGTALQQADIQQIPLEAIGAPTAFGVRLTMKQAPPGVLIRVPVILSRYPTGSDSIFVSLTIMGRVLA